MSRLPARSVVARAHPFTPFAVTAAIACLAFLLPAPTGPVALYLLVIALAVSGGVGRAVRAAALICLPFWFFLFVLHGLMGGGDQLALGPVGLSRTGIPVAIAQAARLGAVITATLALVETFDPSRFLDAVGARRWPFAPAYLLVATLQAVPRLQRRVGLILEAQRTRGLVYRGSPLRRVRALVPLALPLILGALTEVDERAMALEIRGLRPGLRRTPLDPPRDSAVDRAIRWLMAALIVAAAIWRFGWMQ